MKRALIVGGGPVDSRQLREELARKPELIVAADRGGHALLGVGRYPHLAVGDFDSLPGADRSALADAGVRMLSFPAAKDETDLELALDSAVAEGAEDIRILGGLGRRIDHTLGNIGLLLRAAELGSAARLLDPDHELLLAGRALTLPARPGWALSLIPLTPKVCGVRTGGLAFPLCGEELYLARPRGIHNEFCAATATIEVAEGILLVVLFRESPVPG
jgi:thiamine pyrophosphokinase